MIIMREYDSKDELRDAKKIGKNSQRENFGDLSEDQFDWDWIFDREWLRTKK